MAVKVPADVSELNKSGSEALARLLAKKNEPEPPPNGQPSRRTMSKIAELKKEKDGIAKTAEETRAELEAERAEKEELRAKLAKAEQERDEYKPSHDWASKTKRTEVAKLLEALPQERRAKAKNMSEKLNLDDFKEWYGGYSGGANQQQQADKKGSTDFAGIVARNDEKALGAAATADPEGYQKFITSI